MWILSLIYTASLLSLTFAAKRSACDDFPYVTNEANCPYERRAPIPLISSAAKLVQLPQLVLNIPQGTQFRLRNVDGRVFGTPIGSKTATLVGGPAKKSYYDLLQIDHLNDGVPDNTRCAATEDGVGTAAGHAFTFIKRSYGSRENAFQYPDGYINIIIQVHIGGNVPNAGFKHFERALYQVSRSNSTTIIDLKRDLFWLIATLPQCFYYTWPGSTTVNGTTYYSTIFIQIPLVFCPHISYSQFDSYLSIRNQYGSPATHVEPLNPIGGRPVAQVEGGMKVHCFT